ncbi:CDP-alcohol phosphatidyltransferase-domain-containing protein [Fomitopsis serialis]|uniref:CDP-alcohol phosphatidyltransferase-domain-containing protein n=1 Tax=Fomitopsis serialis TaxID=139415 RepID=UPI0020088B81|nr:CDP-alcohol phosphatidyltransferase-domain-containing protein [Neoantrodia serialis]KAH9927003.1 CDP-alcohol phosphatidyltransferase-domain-containing protein [Neoantrodia serialis]
MSTIALLRTASWRSVYIERCVGAHKPTLSRGRALYRASGWSARPFLSCFSVFSPLKANEDQKGPAQKFKALATLRENIYTIPNILTVSRILACPVLGWAIVHDNFHFATALLVYAGLTDTVDGYIARRYKMTSVLGTVLDPAADKTLMTTLTLTLAYKGMIPLPLAAVIFGRDVLLSLAAFYIRYTSLPHPKTFTRYWDMSIPSAEVHPTRISKINTLLQLSLMALTTVSPVLPVDLGPTLQAFQWVVATTTIWSGASYLFTKDAVRIISAKRKPPS